MKRAVFLVTHTPNNEVFWRSLECCGWEVLPYRYDNQPYERHPWLLRDVYELQPDLIVCVGSLGQGMQTPIPTPQTLRQLRDIAPSVLLCGDVADDAWHGTLREYAQFECFDLIVSMDGTDWPGLVTKLTPIDPRPYKPLRWSERDIAIGWTGNGLGEKAQVLAHLGPTHCGIASHGGLATFMCRCRVIANAPRTGGGRADHVKGRVVETGFAGACLLERKNSATARWFRPGIDYVEYDGPGQAAEMAAWIAGHDAEVQAIAANLALRVRTEHSPDVFWRDVLDRLT